MSKRLLGLLFPVLCLVVLPSGGSPLLAQAQEEVVEIFTQHYYDNLYITGNRLASGNLIAYVTLAESPSSSEQTLVVAKYVLNKQTLAGDFTVFGEEGTPEALDFYSYENQPEYTHLEQTVADHNVRSVTLAALMLWEEFEAQKAVTEGTASGNCSDLCPQCTSVPNGCTLVWDSCNGTYIGGACDLHDNCYQCGQVCNGCTRAQCDAQFRADILATGAGLFCARVYWLGVRLIGWLFYNDPWLRPNMGSDVYSLGISINPCPSNMQHLCTTWVM